MKRSIIPVPAPWPAGPRARPGLRRRWVKIALAFTVAAALAGSSCTVVPSAAALIASVCNGTWTFSTTGPVADPSLNEISGVVTSRAHSGVLWVHEDSGAPPRFFALSTAGSVLGSFDVTGASAIDWEDVAIGPGPQAGITYLYLGDIGDNAAARPSVAVYRVPEPAVDASGPPVGAQAVSGDRLTLTYPDGAHNAESLLVDTNGDLYILTKQAGSATIYFAPAGLAGGSTTALTRAGTVALSGSQLLTGGEVSPAGDAIVLRTYGQALAWNRAPGTSVAATLESSRCEADLHSEPQGEAVAFQPDASGLVTLSEGVNQSIGNYRAP